MVQDHLDSGKLALLRLGARAWNRCSLLGLPAGKPAQGLINILAATGCTYVVSSSTQDGDS
ncbi:hypothetical protein CAL13_02835 [Bordetella genomosp. 9]|uniref:Uncharacterized protein n=1 Tax=Bordetella genomosp. 9 TaxID=1416803 RepID=A0A1W6YW82_9BORD|nr:hypothetical protein CAL13_02835 [Bordetella genomosp. 9]